MTNGMKLSRSFQFKFQQALHLLHIWEIELWGGSGVALHVRLVTGARRKSRWLSYGGFQDHWLIQILFVASTSLRSSIITTLSRLVHVLQPAKKNVDAISFNGAPAAVRLGSPAGLAHYNIPKYLLALHLQTYHWHPA